MPMSPRRQLTWRGAWAVPILSRAGAPFSDGTPHQSGIVASLQAWAFRLLLLSILAVVFVEAGALHASTALQPAAPKIPSAADVYQRSLAAADDCTYRAHQITIYWRTGRTIRVLVT